MVKRLPRLVRKEPAPTNAKKAQSPQRASIPPRQPNPPRSPTPPRTPGKGPATIKRRLNVGQQRVSTSKKAHPIKVVDLISLRKGRKLKAASNYSIALNDHDTSSTHTDLSSQAPSIASTNEGSSVISRLSQGTRKSNSQKRTSSRSTWPNRKTVISRVRSPQIRTAQTRVSGVASIQKIQASNRYRASKGRAQIPIDMAKRTIPESRSPLPSPQPPLTPPVSQYKQIEPNSISKQTKRTPASGRRTPDQYRQHVVQNITTPSQLSLGTITEYYTVPDSQFKTIDDVYLHRGYRKIGKIDEGAFGVVSMAMRWSDKLKVAVKEVDLRRRKAKRVEEMKRELFVLQKVSHENVVGLIEHFIVNQMLVIIMEYCAGSNLTTYLKERAIKESEAIGLFKQMAISIRVLHKKGIAHRDVKLNNFLLNNTRTSIKIADFGLSVVTYRRTHGLQMAKTYCGTEPYMAPELLRKNHLGARCYNALYADIWSLGVCLFAMLTRTFPFKVHAAQDGLYKAQIGRKWRFPRSLRSSISDELKDIIWHMLDPEPERRITMNGIMAHPWLNKDQLVVLSYDEGEVSNSNSRNKSK